MGKCVLVTPRSFAALSDEPLRLLHAAGCEVIQLDRPADGCVTEDVMCAAIKGMDAVIVGLEPLSVRVLEAAHKLRVISKYGVGLDNIAVAAARARGIAIGWTPDANSNAVAELTLGLMFALARRIPAASAQTRVGDFSKVVGVELRGRTLGIIGLGRIGQRVALGAIGLGLRVIAYDIRSGLATDPIEPVDLDTLYAQADIISLHIPLTTETAGLIDAAALSKMKRGALLINTARGGLIDEAALYPALQSGQLSGAAIDSFAHEPPIDHPLLTLNNFIGTPHIASHTTEAIACMGRIAAENVIAGLCGEPLPYPYSH
ncbi:MAG TPA: phosphoglycerate dehydrogenase [Anaerolineae bacterium]|nr:phosphoglycerate dehydrogenase [Anaerolineae bacterium]